MAKLIHVSLRSNQWQIITVKTHHLYTCVMCVYVGLESGIWNLDSGIWIPFFLKISGDYSKIAHLERKPYKTMTINSW